MFCCPLFLSLVTSRVLVNALFLLSDLLPSFVLDSPAYHYSLSYVSLCVYITSVLRCIIELCKTK